MRRVTPDPSSFSGHRQLTPTNWFYRVASALASTVAESFDMDW